MKPPRRPAHAEVVGSLLRPPALRVGVEGFYERGHSAVLAEERSKDRTALRDLEDSAIREAVRRQIDLGLDVVTDGEFRRWMFLNSFYDAVEGFRTDNVVNFRNARGEDVPLRVHEIVERLRPVDSPVAREAAFMTEIADGHPFKVTFPAPSLFGHPFSYKPGVTSGYGSLDEFVAHAIEIERGLVADAIAAGARYVQFDFPLYPYLVDQTWVERFEARGHPVARSRRRGHRGRYRRARGHPRRRDRRRCTSAAGTSARRGCARARSNPSPSACSASSRTTRSWSSGTTSAATAGSSRCAT